MTTPNRLKSRISAKLSRVGILIVIILALFTSASTHLSLLTAQRSKEKPYSLIVGTVWGPDNRPVYGVKVKIRRAKDKKPKWEVYSDHHGEFAQRLPVGESDYILSADLKHFKLPDGKPVHLVQDVTVHIYNDEREDTGLHLVY